jgi:hypothetical protein
MIKLILKALVCLAGPLILDKIFSDFALRMALSVAWGGICSFHIWPWIDRKWGKE